MRQLLTIVLLSFFAPLVFAESTTTDIFPDLKALNTERQSDSFIGQGKWTLVKLWSDHCPICEAQAPMLSRLHDKLKADTLEVVGVAIDGLDKADQVQQFLQNKQYSFPSYIGDLAVIALNYQAMTQEAFRGTPTYVLFNTKGEMVAVNPGPLGEGSVEKFIANY